MMTISDLEQCSKVIEENGVQVYKGHTQILLNNFNDIMVNSQNFNLQKKMIESNKLYFKVLMYHINLYIDDDNDPYIIMYLFILFKARWPEVSKLIPMGKDIKIEDASIEHKRMYIFSAVWEVDIINNDFIIYLMDRSKLDNLKGELMRRYITYES